MATPLPATGATSTSPLPMWRGSRCSWGSRCVCVWVGGAVGGSCWQACAARSPAPSQTQAAAPMCRPNPLTPRVLSLPALAGCGGVQRQRLHQRQPGALLCAARAGCGGRHGEWGVGREATCVVRRRPVWGVGRGFVIARLPASLLPAESLLPKACYVRWGWRRTWRVPAQLPASKTACLPSCPPACSLAFIKPGPARLVAHSAALPPALALALPLCPLPWPWPCHLQAHTSIRFGVGRFTTEAEVDRAVELTVQHVNKVGAPVAGRWCCACLDWLGPPTARAPSI